MNNERIFCDNVWVRTPKGTRGEFFQIIIDPHSVTFNRYVVPGRCDVYTFRWNSSTETGIGSTVSMFSDFDLSLRAALNRVNTDLKKPQVKRLLKRALRDGVGGIGMTRKLLQQIKMK